MNMIQEVRILRFNSSTTTMISSGINDDIRARVLTILESDILSGGGRYRSLF